MLKEATAAGIPLAQALALVGLRLPDPMQSAVANNGAPADAAAAKAQARRGPRVNLAVTDEVIAAADALRREVAANE